MCGPSNEEVGLAKQQSNLSGALSSAFDQNYEKQSSALQTLNYSLNPVVSAGLGQHGFTSQELADLNTQALNTTGANYGNAARAVNGQLAGHTSDSGLESGVSQQIKASLASSAAGQISSEQSQIGLADAQTGENNYWKAIGGQQALANAYNPAPYGGEATDANKLGFGEASQINTERQQLTKDLVGGISGAALSFASGGLSNLGKGENFGEGLGDFFKGGIGALSGNG